MAILAPRLENVTDETKETAPPMIKTSVRVHAAKKKTLAVGTFVSLAIDTNINSFWKDHATAKFRTRKAHEILELLSPCWETNYMDRLFSAGKTIFDRLIQDLLSMSINLLLALYLVFARYFIQNGPRLYF